MKNVDLPIDLSLDIRNYMISTQSTMDQQIEMDRFLNLICPSLKLKVSWQLFRVVINSNSVFLYIKKNNKAIAADVNEFDDTGGGSDLVSIIVRKLTILLTAPEDYIIKQDDTGNYFIFLAYLDKNLYLVARGETLITIKDTNRLVY